MKKKYTGFLLLAVMVLLALVKVLPAMAQSSGYARMLDYAGVLSEKELDGLETMLGNIRQEHDFDVVIAVIDSTEGQSPMAYADDFYDYNGYGCGPGRDGIMLLVALGDRKWAISTSGSGIDYFTDAGQSYITDRMKPYLSDGEYAKAFRTFAQDCEDFLVSAENGTIYDSNNMPKKPLSGLWYLLSLGIGAGGASAVTAGLKGQLKSVHFKSGAEDYVKNGSFQLTKEDDLFLYSRVSRVRKPKNEGSRGGGGGGSTIHTSSSGHTHGGSSGSF
ncbi:MAG: TPM domain-containing protein [Blautia sp.]|nr:TPM domain-containing protein [Blautia sp.]